MEKEKELQELERQYHVLIDRYRELDERLCSDKGLNDEDNALLEDQICALRCYLNALLDSIEYLKSLIEDEKSKCKKAAKKSKGKNEKENSGRTVNITERISLSDKDVDKILKSLCASIGRLDKFRLV